MKTIPARCLHDPQQCPNDSPARPFWHSTPSAQTGSLAAVSALLARHLLALLPCLGERDGNRLLAALHPAGPAARAAFGGAALVAMHFVLHFPARPFGIFSTLGHLQLRERKVRPC